MIYSRFEYPPAYNSLPFAGPLALSRRMLGEGRSAVVSLILALVAEWPEVIYGSRALLSPPCAGPFQPRDSTTSVPAPAPALAKLVKTAAGCPLDQWFLTFLALAASLLEDGREGQGTGDRAQVSGETRGGRSLGGRASVAARFLTGHVQG